MTQIGLTRPEALPLLAVVVILAALAVWADSRRRRALAAFAGGGAERMSVSTTRRRVKAALRVAALLLGVVALTGPYVDVVQRTVVQSGVDVVVALDVSQSMAVRDADPDRLRAAKAFIARLGDRLRQSRVALVLFAGEGIVRYPPTSDPAVLGQTLDSVTLAFRPPGGSSLGKGVAAALAAFPDDTRRSSRSKAVVLVTDGEDTTAQAPDVEALKGDNVRVFTVGVGTPSGGPIPTYDRRGAFAGYLTKGSGQQVISRLTEEPLRAIASGTGGRYWRLAGIATANDLATELRRLDATSLGDSATATVPDDRYQPFLLLAILLLVADGLLDQRRPMPRPRGLPAARAPRRLPLPGFAARVAALVGLVLAACSGGGASDAERLYRTGDAEAALERYRALLVERPNVPELHVNTGDPLFVLGRYDEAIAEYAIGIKEGDERTRAVAFYQRGDTLYRQGKLEEAREAFKDALRLDPNDRDAKFNIEVIDRVLDVTQQQNGSSHASPQPGASGSPVPGGRSGEGPPTPGGPQSSADPGAPLASPGTVGPQASGPPGSDQQGNTGASLSDALNAFRSSLSPEEALRLLDALTQQQRGIVQLLEGDRGQNTSDPSY